MEHTVPFDVWARPVRLPISDIHVPTTMSTRKSTSLRDHANAIFANMKNGLRNTFSLYRMAREQSFPDAKVKRTWSLDLFKVQSTPWLKPFTRIALDTYKQVNQAFAAGDEKTVKRLTISNYEEDLRRRLRSQNANYVYVWKFHGESKPAKVVSIRAEEVNLSSSPVTYGNRLLIQACVKFETTQSLEVYTKRGERVAGDGTPKPVVEYLVFQKRMWYDTPWVIRDQLFEGLQGRYTTTL
ncbi:hypothetical protein PHLGIDRAFT_89777 [Phlebiopsis gigantea 11061_1 CR5-6]|uniref:Tim44-like domain-containing protein n=1 Tax=Phlebiopsis gigantea (strain 11061_1 CR5-6) TaxID=745531 RepID=A0A0C3NQA0_PHLG1|nr:hypothetical protein PHLGIDRAFT_89777 [Phlebiopsis gigantea 11061_1 CR5-6]